MAIFYSSVEIVKFALILRPKPGS